MLGIAGRLPLQPTPLIGRDREVEAIGQRLGAGGVRLLTLSGPPGVGKTRLGIAAAAALNGRFAGGSVFVDLAPLGDPGLVVSAIARALGVQETAGEPLLATLSNALAETALLLLLDNFEHLLPAAPVIAELLTRCPALVVLVTSRAPLHLRWEHAYPVHPLALPDAADLSSLEDLAAVPAVALFLERARAVRPDFSLSEESAAAVAAICRHLEGLPLALELAAARLRLLAPDMLLARLTGVGSAAAPDSPLQLLRGGPADAPARQQTLRDAIGWSYRLLSEGEQILVRRLAVFAGGCTLAAVEAVCGAAPLGAAEVLDGLAGLTDAALVHQEEQAGSEARYRMLELIREYAAERLAESGEAVAVRRRHADSCLALAEEAEPGLKSGQRELWLGRLDAELANIRAALAWSEADAASVETGLRLATALEWYWHFRNHWREGRDCLERLLTQAGLEVPVAARAKALYVSGQLAVFLTDYEQAGERLEASTVLFRELDDPHGLGYALCYRSRLEARRRNLDAARSLAEESAACFRRTGDSWGLALACNYIANAADRQDDVREARARAAESISLFRALGDTWGIGPPSEVLVDVALRQGDYATARAAGEEALACVRTTGEGLAIASLLGSLADVAQLEGDDLRLERLCTESLELQRKLPDRAGVARSLLGLARVALRRNDAGRAASLCAEALARSGAGTHKPGAALGLATLASVAESQGQPAMAARMAGAADALIEAAGFPPWPAERMEYERGLPLRLELCERFPADWAQGRTMSLAEAVELGRSTAVTLQGLATTDLHAAASHPSPPSDPDGLTARQVEILDLLAASRNNTEIAAALVPSIRTIERHVENIYEKLGIHGNAARARVAAYALRRGPAGAGDSRQKRRQVSLCIDPSSPVGRVTVRLRRISCAFENTRFARLTCASERMPAFACSPYTPDAGWLAGCRRRRPPAWRRASRHQSV